MLNVLLIAQATDAEITLLWGPSPIKADRCDMTRVTLQRLEGLSDREAVSRFEFDARWRYAAGVGGYGAGGWPTFAHTVLVDMRARLAT